VLVFAFGGKSSHEASSSDWIVLAIVWPFVASVLVAHVLLLVRGLDARRVWPEGALVLFVTYVVGMVLRVLSGRGIEVGFLVVALLFLALTMLGWRSVVRLGARRGVGSAR
jgi:predicted Abi (CAAX) family protease